jgi:hypothetical protein
VGTDGWISRHLNTPNASNYKGNLNQERQLCIKELQHYDYELDALGVFRCLLIHPSVPTVPMLIYESICQSIL